MPGKEGKHETDADKLPVKNFLILLAATTSAGVVYTRDEMQVSMAPSPCRRKQAWRRQIFFSWATTNHMMHLDESDMILRLTSVNCTNFSDTSLETK